jgi:hypothetical protein
MNRVAFGVKDEPVMIDPRDVEEGAPLAAVGPDGQIYFGDACWVSGKLFVQTEHGRILVISSAEIIGWTPRLDFGGDT